MERFLKRHEGRIKGIISGFDRILFRGTLRSICYSKGMEIWLSSRGILMKNFAPCAEQLSKQLKEHARTLPEKHGRPLLYLESSKQSKEDCAREIMKEQGVEKGLICILSCVESCRSYTVRKDWKAKLIHLFLRERKWAGWLQSWARQVNPLSLLTTA